MTAHAPHPTPASSTHGSGHPHAGDHAHGGIGKYIVVFVLLCVLTSASYFTTTSWWQERIPSEVSWVMMLTVSCFKALLVILCFMHLYWEANWKWVLTIPAALMSVFLVLMLVPDIGLRTMNYSEERWSGAAYPQAPDGHGAHEPEKHPGEAGPHDGH